MSQRNSHISHVSHVSHVTYTPDELEYLRLSRPMYSEMNKYDTINDLEENHIIDLRKNWKETKRDDCKNYEQYLKEKIDELRKGKEKFRQSIKGDIIGKSVYLLRKRMSRSVRPSSKRGGKHTHRKTQKESVRKTRTKKV